MKPDQVVEKVFKACMENDESIIEIYDEIKDSQIMKLSQIKKILHNTMFNNGVFNRLIPDCLTEEQKFSLSLWTLNFDYEKATPNKYYASLLRFYANHLNDSFDKINYESLPWIRDYYQKTPSVFVIEKFKEEFKTPEIKLNSKYLSYISDLIKIGKSIQFDCAGFVKNEMYYLMAGACVVYHIVNYSKFDSFKSLVKSVQSFIQLMPNSISISSELFNDSEGYALSTALTINKHEGFSDSLDELNFNFRYKPAFKYLDEMRNSKGRTEIKNDEQGIHLLTKMNNDDIAKMWDEFEELFIKGDYENLIVSWFDSQCLTRSTCLIGMLIFMILNKKTMTLLKDELMDWKAIICGDISKTYKFDEDIDVSKFESFKDFVLIDLLTLFKFYINVISLH